MPATRPVRATLASEFWSSATARGLIAGLRSSGWLVDEVDIREFLPGPTTLSDRALARVRYNARKKRLQGAILDSTRQHRADVFLTVKGVDVDRATLAALSKRGITSVNYYPDYHFNDIPIERMADYDLVATTKSFHLEPLRKIMPAEQVAFIHHGYVAEVHRPVPHASAPEVDVLYVGNATAPKAAIMIALADAMPEIKLRVVGHRWLDFARGTALEPAVAGFGAHSDYYAAEIARAKIILAFHMGADPATGFADLVSTRSFEIPACGGFMLHIDNDEVRSLYDVPSEIDTFSDVDDLVAKVRYWLAHPEERAAVAARGYARAVPAYSYTERGRELAALIESKLGR